MEENVQQAIEQALVETIVNEELEKQAIAEIADEIDALSVGVAALTGADPVEISTDIAAYVGRLLNEAKATE